jgi:hypothetical protein
MTVLAGLEVVGVEEIVCSTCKELARGRAVWAVQ